jgi:hypothetical protein
VCPSHLNFLVLICISIGSSSIRVHSSLLEMIAIYNSE